LQNYLRPIALWGVLFAAAFALFFAFARSQAGSEILAYSEFLSLVEAGSVERVKIVGQQIEGRLRGAEGGPEARFRTTAPTGNMEGLIPALRKAEVLVEAEEPKGSSLATILAGVIPMLILLGVIIFFFRQMQVGGNKALSFGKSKARLQSDAGVKVTFDDVAGLEEAKEDLREIIDYLKEPQRFGRLGGRVPTGVLLLGPPGTGKTLLARAVAGEADVPFFSVSGSDFVEMFVGVGASRVRDVFEQGKKNAPCIIFIDELDAVGRHRGAGLGGGHDEREQTLNQLLVEMDGFEVNQGVILLAATNRPDVLDPALMRPGRFDRRVMVDLPDIGGRLGILQVHTRKVPLADEVGLEVLARGTPGFSGADLENVVNEAALSAARHDQDHVTMVDFEQAKDKVLMGPEKRSMIISEDEKRTTASHEAGHALVAALVEGADPLHKVTIIPRGMAMGVTMQLPIDDRHTYSRGYLETTIAVMMGGRAAEELLLDQQTTGAGNDIKQATSLARRMVCEWGMSEALGTAIFTESDEQVFLGREIGRLREHSDKTAELIDSEVKRIVDQGMERARTILQGNHEALGRIVGALLERESLDGDEIHALVRGEELEPLPAGPPAPAGEEPAPEKPGPAEPEPDAEEESGPNLPLTPVPADS